VCWQEKVGVYTTVGYNDPDNRDYFSTGGIAMSELTLELTEKARQKIKDSGGEGFVIVRRLGAG
jgi:hypothetical protein